MTQPTYAEYIRVRLVTDADTPERWRAMNGEIIAVPGDAPLPQDPGEYRLLGEFPGYARQAAAGWEWIVTGVADKLLAAVDAVPGAGGFVVESSRDVYRRFAVRLRRAGIPGPQIPGGLSELYHAAAADARARPTP